MKITLDIPDNTLCAFLNYVYIDCSGMTMGTHALQSDDLKDGNEIKINEKGGVE